VSLYILTHCTRWA